MKLLFDANLAPRLVQRLGDLFPESAHVFDIGDIATDDRLIWQHAGAMGMTIVTKDSDFQAMSLVLGHPPKVVRLRIGNCPTSVVENLLRNRHDLIIRFAADSRSSLLLIDDFGSG